MSTDAQQFLNSLESLPPVVQQEVEAEIVHRAARREAINCKVQPNGSESVADENSLPPDEWVRSFQEWERSHKGARNPNVDCSRESIYGDDGR